MLNRITSDHDLIELKKEKDGKKNFPFKFEIIWMTHQDFKIKLKEWWNTRFKGTTMFRLVKKLDEVKKNLNIWNKKIFENVHCRKSIMKVRLEEIESKFLSKGRIIDINKKEKQILDNYYNTITLKDKL